MVEAEGMELGLPGRFWAKVIRRPAGDGCFDWVGCTSKHGYGKFGVASMGGRGWALAHRLVLAAVLKRPIAPGMEAIHSCDRPCCVNPAHLSEATHTDNMRDCARKGRRQSPDVRGEAHGGVKLTNEAILAIRGDPRSQCDIAAAYGVSYSLVSQVKRRRIWKHIP